MQIGVFSENGTIISISGQHATITTHTHTHTRIRYGLTEVRTRQRLNHSGRQHNLISPSGSFYLAGTVLIIKHVNQLCSTLRL